MFSIMMHVKLPQNSKTYKNTKHTKTNMQKTNSCICQSDELAPHQSGSLQVNWSGWAGGIGRVSCNTFFLWQEQRPRKESQLCSRFPAPDSHTSTNTPMAKAQSQSLGKYIPPSMRPQKSMDVPYCYYTRGRGDSVQMIQPTTFDLESPKGTVYLLDCCN